MIHINNHNIVGVYSGSKNIVAVYSGYKLVWEKFSDVIKEIQSCYAKGYWDDQYPWTDDTAWTDQIN